MSRSSSLDTRIWNPLSRRSSLHSRKTSDAPSRLSYSSQLSHDTQDTAIWNPVNGGSRTHSRIEGDNDDEDDNDASFALGPSSHSRASSKRKDKLPSHSRIEDDVDGDYDDGYSFSLKTPGQSRASRKFSTEIHDFAYKGSVNDGNHKSPARNPVRSQTRTIVSESSDNATVDEFDLAPDRAEQWERQHGWQSIKMPPRATPLGSSGRPRGTADEWVELAKPRSNTAGRNYQEREAGLGLPRQPVEQRNRSQSRPNMAARYYQERADASAPNFSRPLNASPPQEQEEPLEQSRAQSLRSWYRPISRIPESIVDDDEPRYMTGNLPVLRAVPSSSSGSLSGGGSQSRSSASSKSGHSTSSNGRRDKFSSKGLFTLTDEDESTPRNSTISPDTRYSSPDKPEQKQRPQQQRSPRPAASVATISSKSTTSSESKTQAPSQTMTRQQQLLQQRREEAQSRATNANSRTYSLPNYDQRWATTSASSTSSRTPVPARPQASRTSTSSTLKSLFTGKDKGKSREPDNTRSKTMTALAGQGLLDPSKTTTWTTWDNGQDRQNSKSRSRQQTRHDNSTETNNINRLREKHSQSSDASRTRTLSSRGAGAAAAAAEKSGFKTFRPTQQQHQKRESQHFHAPPPTPASTYASSLVSSSSRGESNRPKTNGSSGRSVTFSDLTSADSHRNNKRSSGVQDGQVDAHEALAGLSEAEIARLKKKGIDPLLYAQMRATQKKKGKLSLGGLVGGVWVS
ncbi:MAG: hypothetical protein M1831_003305 [Alyxoria varia]|nr:MAG: hypothetical protein M1831_003305 [Alyxoria varia]